jgi:hypothetical protein
MSGIDSELSDERAVKGSERPRMSHGWTRRNQRKVIGRGEWIRTTGLLVPNQALYQAEPRPDECGDPVGAQVLQC